MPYQTFVEDAKQRILSARIKVAKSASKEQIELYWWLGKHIVDSQAKYGWGKSVVDNLSQDLGHLFSGTTYGFSSRNLWDMRRFYLEYKDHENLRQVVAEIPWGQNLLIINKIKDTNAREYYLRATAERGWTRAVLEIQIESQDYERNRLEKKSHNFEKTLPVHLAEQAEKTLKSVYMLDTLGLTAPVLESQIEQEMVSKIKTVLLELGYGFAFIGNQYRIVSPSGTERVLSKIL